MRSTVWIWVLILFFAVALVSCGDDDDDDSGDDDVVGDDDIADDDDDTVSDDDDDDNDDNDDTGPIQSGCIEGDFDPYWGVFHSHTGYSDGVQTPADAFAHGRDEGELDILIVSDHLESILLPPPLDKFGKCNQQAADVYEPGVYLPLCGVEYSSGAMLPDFTNPGHNNFFFIDDINRFPIIMLRFREMYRQFVACPTCIGQFNHPNVIDRKNWSYWEYHADVDERMNLYEFNGGGPTWEVFFDALDAGWHLSPSNNQDNHDVSWGTRNEWRTGAFLADLTTEELNDAMMTRRTFATYDKNAYIKLTAEETCWMGSILSGYGSLAVDVEVSDADPGDGFETIELYGPGMTLLGTVNCDGLTTCAGDFDLTITEPTYLLARADQTDGHFLVSAPIWVTP
jgi:hypothetical protein